MLCTDLTFVQEGDRGLHARPLKCKRWSCPYCQPIRHRQLIAKAASGKPDTFLTLTSFEDTAETPVEAAQVLVVAWRKVRAEACRRYGYKSIPFIAVFEETKRGWPHLHILARCKWLDKRWLVERMTVHARAPIVDIKRVRSVRSAARYLMKYVGKAPCQFGTCKRYWTSRDYDDGTWRAHHAHQTPASRCYVALRRFSLYRRDREQEGYTVEDDGDGIRLRWLRRGPEPPDVP